MPGCACWSQMRSEAIFILHRGSSAQPLSFLGLDTSQLDAEQAQVQNYLNSIQSNYGNWTSNWGGGTSSGTLTPSGYTWNVSSPYYNGSGTVPVSFTPHFHSQLRPQVHNSLANAGNNTWQRGLTTDLTVKVCHAQSCFAWDSGAIRQKARSHDKARPRHDPGWLVGLLLGCTCSWREGLLHHRQCPAPLRLRYRPSRLPRRRPSHRQPCPLHLQVCGLAPPAISSKSNGSYPLVLCSPYSVMPRSSAARPPC